MANYYFTPTGDGAKTGVDWDNAGGVSELKTLLEVNISPGDVVYVYSGTYEFSSGSGITSALDGTAFAFIQVVGVSDKVTLEEAYGDDRPTFTETGTASISFVVRNYWTIKNLKIINSGRFGFQLGVGFIINCSVESSYASSNFTGFNIGSNSIIGCDVKGNGYGTGIYTYYGSPMFCSVDNCTTGISVQTTSNTNFNIISNCDTGIYSGLLSYRGNYSYINNTFYNCTTGISFATGHSAEIAGVFIVNSTISDCNTGINFVRDLGGLVVFKKCNFYNNTIDTVNVSAVMDFYNYDPKFTDAANKDFSLQSDSPLLNLGISAHTGIF